MTTFAAFVPLGPSPNELERLSDLIESVLIHEPDIEWMVLVDDARWGDAVDRVVDSLRPLPGSCRFVRILNPRLEQGSGWAGGSCVGTLAALSWIQRNTDSQFCVRLDTDALVIGPFAEKVRARFGANSELGMLGSCYTYPGGRIRNDEHWVPSIKTFLSAVTLRGRYLQITLWGRPRRYRQALEAALTHGYRFAEHVQGGAYAICREMLERLRTAGHLDDPLTWLRSGITEDIMLGILTRAVDLRPADFNGRGEPFGIQHAGLAFSPEEMLARGHSIIHSIKDTQQFREEDVRRFFQQQRRRQERDNAANRIQRFGMI